MKNACTMLFLLLSAALPAQDLAESFGIVSQREMDMTSYEKDPEAPAVVLFDLGDSYFYDHEGGYNIRFTRVRRVKIFDRSAIDQAEVSIPFYVDGYGKTERVASIEAFTYNFENGRPVKKALDQSAVFEERINERWYARKFVFPDVQAGSVIEYRYVLETPFHFNLPDWTFQDKIPTIYSQYRVSMIPFYEYAYIVQGTAQFDVHYTGEGRYERTWGNVGKAMGLNYGSGVEFRDLIHTYGMKDVPAFKDESYITSANDYLMKLDFQLSRFFRPQGGSTDIITTWEKLSESLLKHDRFGDFIRDSRKQARKILDQELDVRALPADEQAERLVHYVRQNLSWDKNYGKYAVKSVKDLLDQKSGSAAEINLFLTGLLQEAGINARPVIISTRGHGKIRTEYPFEHFFNYVLVFVETERPFLTDATEKALPYNRIPPRCINEVGLVVQEGKAMWLNLNSEIEALDSKQIQIKIDPETRTAGATISSQATEYEAYRYRTQFRDDADALKKYFLDRGLSAVEAVRTSRYEDPDKPYIIGVKGTCEIEQLGSNLLLSPFLGFPMQENLLKQPTRSYPVDFIYPRTDRFHVLLEVPAGYELSDLPENFQESNELVDIKLTYEPTAAGLTINGHYTLRKSTYQPEEYSRIREYLDLIVRKFNAQLVLRRS